MWPLPPPTSIKTPEVRFVEVMKEERAEVVASTMKS